MQQPAEHFHMRYTWRDSQENQRCGSSQAVASPHIHGGVFSPITFPPSFPFAFHPLPSPPVPAPPLSSPRLSSPPLRSRPPIAARRSGGALTPPGRQTVFGKYIVG